jgi:glycosyltransferase involved in cell wall biosynthesis
MDWKRSQVSVVIPTHNRGAMLREALESVLAQTLAPSEIVVVDDGSTDNTPEIATRFGNKIKYIYSPPRGVSHARNLGWRSAGSPWIAFLDSDDLWLPRKLERQLQCLAQDPGAAACYTDEIWIRNGKRVNPCKHHAKYSGWIFPHCLPRCIISPSSVLVRREILEELGGFDEEMEVCEDYDLWLRLTARYQVVYLEEKLIVKRGGHPDQLSRRFWGLDRFRIRSLIKIIEDKTIRDEYRLAALGELRRKCAIYAQGAMKRGKVEEARYYFSLPSLLENSLRREQLGSY